MTVTPYILRCPVCGRGADHETVRPDRRTDGDYLVVTYWHGTTGCTTTEATGSVTTETKVEVP